MSEPHRIELFVRDDPVKQEIEGCLIRHFPDGRTFLGKVDWTEVSLPSPKPLVSFSLPTDRRHGDLILRLNGKAPQGDDDAQEER